MSGVVILDGGMGKELRRIGAPFRQPQWSSLALIEAPEMVTRAHRNFVEAGAEVIITNNYAVVPYHHPDGLFDERGEELVALAGRLAREVADEAPHPVRVAGSMPPLFGSYEPEHVDVERAAPLYALIATALVDHVDLWVGETLSTIDEMRVIVDAIDTVASTAPIWISFALPERQEPDGEFRLRSGETLAEIVDALVELCARRTGGAPIEALLINCSLPERTGPALARLRDLLDGHTATDVGHVATGGYANALPVERDAGYRANEVIFERREEITADHYAAMVATWIDDGATIVGGCCDMYPEHIAELARRFGSRT